MSSNLEIPKTCQHCGGRFIAKKTSTRFCSVPCAQRNYKVRQRMSKMSSANKLASGKIDDGDAVRLAKIEEPDLIDILDLSYATSMSKRTIYRLLKDPEFPKIKIGKRLLFDKKKVIQYLFDKYSS